MVALEERPVFLNTNDYIIVKGTKETLDFLAFQGGDNVSGKFNVAASDSPNAVKYSARGTEQKGQRSNYISSDRESRLRVAVPLKKADGKKTKRYVTFPKGTNLLIVARVLFRITGIENKLKTYKGKYAYRVQGGAWHPIFNPDATELKKIIDEEKEAKKKAREANREGTTEDIDGDEP